MTRLVNKPVWVETDGCNRPLAFHRYGQRIRISLLEEWRDTGAWWKGEPEKVFYRVQSEDGGLFELYYEQTLPPECGGQHPGRPSPIRLHPAGRWFLYRIYD